MYQDVDAMWEADAAAEWERLNAPDPMENEMKEAAKQIKFGLDSVDAGLAFFAEAVSALGESPMADRVQSFLDDFESLANKLEELKNHYERGERE